ncbi:hypothetical protein EDD22DRAFT_950980 [Suillus occidentalis]|nr:hypothetical protein EDD22DRAFT_950980 [Suillus occidentalis]
MHTSSPTSSPPRSSSPAISCNSSGGSSGGKTLIELSTINVTNLHKKNQDFSPDYTTSMLSEQTNSSPKSMSSVLSALDDGVPRPLSPTDQALNAPDGKESLFFRPPSTNPPPGASPRGQFLQERMLRKHHPYPLRPALLELRFAARVTGRVRQPEFTPEEIEEHEQLAESGLSQMSLSTLYKAFKAKLASRETARQRLLTTTWELEEAERYTSFLEAFHAENKEVLGLEDAKLERMRAWFSARNKREVEDDTNYLQAVYDDECEILRSLTTQAQQVSKILGKRTDGIFSTSTGESTSKPPLDGPLIADDGDSSLDFSDLED